MVVWSSMALHALLAAVLLAQTPTNAAEPISPFAGVWSGTAKVSVGPDTAPCRYTPPDDANAVTIRLDDAATMGSVAIDLPASGKTCPAIVRSYEVVGVHRSGNSLSLTDDSAHEWNLTLREGRLKGLVSGSNLSGEFELAATTEENVASTATPTATPSPAPAKAGGSFLKGTGGVIAANVVGLGALVGLNQALKDTQQSSGGSSCSPRSCVVIGTDCNCPTGNQVEGGSCGTTANGVPYGGACALPSLPCQATLSCNNGVCDDVRCPVASGPVTRH